MAKVDGRATHVKWNEVVCFESTSAKRLTERQTSDGRCAYQTRPPGIGKRSVYTKSPWEEFGAKLLPMGGSGGGGVQGVCPPFVPRCRLFNIGPKIGPPSVSPFFACIDLIWAPLSKILDPPLLPQVADPGILEGGQGPRKGRSPRDGGGGVKNPLDPPLTSGR